MSLEEKIEALTKAVEENTAAHAKLAEVAIAAASAKPAAEKAKPAPEKAPEKAEEEEKPKETAAQKKKRLAAEKKAKEAAEAKTSEEPDLDTEVSFDSLKKLCSKLLEDESRKSDFIGALSHLGAKKLTDVGEDDYPKLAAYVSYWLAGLDVNFEEIDEKLADLSEGGDDGDDDPLG